MPWNTSDAVPRYEIVLLEDDPETRRLIEQELTRRGIVVHAFAHGEDALSKVAADPGIGALLTDIEILDPYPDGDFARLQGYDVANRLVSAVPNRLLSVVVMTHLPGEEAFDSLNSFRVPVTTFHKDKWIRAGEETVASAFDKLARQVKASIERTPHAFYDEVQRNNPKSWWITHDYWQAYRSLWFSRDWALIEGTIAERASEVVRGYRDGDLRGCSLRGDLLTFPECPTPAQLPDHLVGRRVVYGLKFLEPDHWAMLVCGKTSSEDETHAFSHEVWNAIGSDMVRTLINRLNRKLSDHNLAELHENYAKLSPEKRKLYGEEKAAAQPTVLELAMALEGESDAVRAGLTPFLRFWDLDFRKVHWTVKPGIDKRDEQNLRQTLLLLGIRKEDIDDDNPTHWRLLLPEERAWLRRLSRY